VPPVPRVVPVGRLDSDTTGALLLTNDGDLAHRLAHPRYEVDKVYEVDVEGDPAEDALRRLREGVDLDDGRTLPARVRLVQQSATGTSALEIVVQEGRKRMVRRMCSSVGHPVVRLVRTRIGPLRDPKLAPGHWRPLTSAEVRALYASALTKGEGSQPEPG